MVWVAQPGISLLPSLSQEVPASFYTLLSESEHCLQDVTGWSAREHHKFGLPTQYLHKIKPVNKTIMRNNMSIMRKKTCLLREESGISSGMCYPVSSYPCSSTQSYVHAHLAGTN